MNKIALVFGVGQSIAFYLVKFLLDKNYQVHGMTDDPQMFPEEYLKRLYNILPQEKHNFVLHYGQLSDTMGVMKLVKQTTPNEIYNLATSNHISGDDEGDEYGANINGLCALRVLDAVRLMGMDKRTRIYQASTSDIFGNGSKATQTETTPIYPRSSFAVAKVYAYWITVNYREDYNMFACNGILFNHESPIRGEYDVFGKIVRGVSGIAMGLQEKIYVGNLDAHKDWGHVLDYVQMMWLSLQAEEPEDWVIATGEATTVRQLVTMSFAQKGVDIYFKGSGVYEIGMVGHCTNKKYQFPEGTVVLCVDAKYYNPYQADPGVGNATKAREKLGWTPQYGLDQMVHEAIEENINSIKRDRALRV